MNEKLPQKSGNPSPSAKPNFIHPRLDAEVAELPINAEDIRAEHHRGGVVEHGRLEQVLVLVVEPHRQGLDQDLNLCVM